MMKPFFKDGAPLVSIIVRTKNEERWIGSCLRAINRQSYRKFEIVLVDNESTDQTVAKAVPFGVKVVQIGKFLPGKALNDGIRASSGQILVCLSGHCIPANETWLENLIRDLRDPEVAGVYGRQQPLSFSSDLDKRDLMLVFGLDKKIQVKDSFFHNANSAIRRETWELYPFDEHITNIEDRLWGRQVLSAGMKIIYEPEASVYHWHGIHQDMDRERARSVVRILEQIERNDSERYNDISDLYVVGIIPSKGELRLIDYVPLIGDTLRHSLDARHIKETVVATDNEATAEAARSMGAKALIRPPSLSEDYVDLTDVLQFALEAIEANGPVPDLVAIMEETHPFRPAGLIDSMIVKLVSEGMDSLIAARREPRRLWVSEHGKIRDLVEGGFMPRQFKNTVAYISLFGLGCITHPAFIRDGSLLGANAGIFELDDPFCAIEIRNQESLARSAPLLQVWQREAVGG